MSRYGTFESFVFCHNCCISIRSDSADHGCRDIVVQLIDQDAETGIQDTVSTIRFSLPIVFSSRHMSLVNHYDAMMVVASQGGWTPLIYLARNSRSVTERKCAGESAEPCKSTMPIVE